MRFASIPLRNVVRRPARSLLTGLGVAAAIGSFVALVGLSRGIERAWTEQFRQRGVDVIAMRRGALDVLTSSLPEALAAKLRSVPGVADVAAQLGHLVTLESGDTALLEGLAPGSYLWRALRFDSGGPPPAAEPESVVLGSEVAAVLHKRRGDSMTLIGRSYVVAGVTKRTGIIESSSILMLLPALQELVGREGKASGFSLRLEPNETPEARAALLRRLSEAFPILVFYEAERAAGGLDMLVPFRAIAWGTSVVAVLVAIVIVLNTLLTSVVERTGEIGVLRALGWGPGRVLGMIVIEGLALALLGTLLGVALGAGGLRWLSSVPIVRSCMTPTLDIRTIGEVCVAAVAAGVVGGLYPAWRAVRLNPVDALRHE